MSVKISALDYRAGSTLLDQQTTAINQFLSDKTVTQIAVCDEFIMAHYTAAPLVGLPHKIKVFSLANSVTENGIQATENAINTFITNNVTSSPQAPITLDSGFIVLVYK